MFCAKLARQGRPVGTDVGPLGILFCPQGRDEGLMAKYNPIEFIQEVRSEVAKVTWPSTKEVWITTVAVLIMVVAASLFFTAADQILGWFVKSILGIGS
jgi:preprotein translocase subunit SecE